MEFVIDDWEDFPKSDAFDAARHKLIVEDPFFPNLDLIHSNSRGDGHE
jgi:hypothetical protein